MKDENEIYEQYIKSNFNRPWFFGKAEHWKTYYEGYEMGYHAATEESLNSMNKELGIDIKNFPTNVNEQFKVMREALQKYYKEKGNRAE